MQRVVLRNSQASMPTPARVIAAMGFMAVAFAVVQQMDGLMPSGAKHQGLLPVALAFGVILGWRVIGPATGASYGAALRAGLRSSVYLGLSVLLFLGILQMLVRSVRGLYRSPFDALLDVSGQTIDLGLALLQPEVLLLLGLGGMATALVAQWVSRRFL